MNNQLFYCRSFQIIYYFIFPEKIDIILAVRLELWTSIFTFYFWSVKKCRVSEIVCVFLSN